MNIQLIQIPHDTYHDISYSFPGQSVTVGVSLYVLCLTSMSEVDMVIMKLSQRNFVFLGIGHKINITLFTTKIMILKYKLYNSKDGFNTCP